MRCGEKCFYVETEIDGQKRVESVNARTPAEARKTIRKEHGRSAAILSVKKKNR